MRPSSALSLPSPPIIRMGHLMAFSGFLADEGVPIDPMLSRAGLPTLCGDKDCFVPLTHAWSFFDNSARSIGPGLGWLVGKYVGDKNLNAAVRAKLEKAPSLYQALYRLVDSVSAEASHVQIGTYERTDDVLIYTCYPGMGDLPGYHQSQAYQLGVFLDLVRRFLGRHWSPEVVGIQALHSPVDIDLQFPGSRILVEQPIGYLAIPRDRIHETTIQGESNNPVESALLPNHVFDFENTLRELLASYLSDGYPSSSKIAQLMNISERTLARRLSKLGLTYGELVDEARFTVAKTLLKQPDAKISDVAIQAGFHDQSNFARMFRRIAGLSPREFRKAILKGNNMLSDSDKLSD